MNEKNKIESGEKREREGENEMEKRRPSSADYWYFFVVFGKTIENFDQKMTETLKSEIPSLCTITMERNCNLGCAHCIYQPEKSSKKYSNEVGLGEIIKNIVRQMPNKQGSSREENPCLVHDGRILSKWHLDILYQVYKMRPDIEIGIIDNGSYTKLLNWFKNYNFKLNNLDISIDGTEESHNNQRDPVLRNAYKEAVNGLKHAREVVLPKEQGGRVSSLMTLTAINHRDIEKAAWFVFSPNSNAPIDPNTRQNMDYADEFHITTMTPTRESHVNIEISTEQLKEAWNQIKKIYEKYGEKKVFFKLYSHEDLGKLSEVVGREKFLKSFERGGFKTGIGSITFKIEGVSITFFPNSIWPQETFLIDSDGANRVAFSLKHTIEELQRGKGKDGFDTRIYTVKQLDNQSNFIETYRQGVDHWWKHFGRNFLGEEIKTFKKIRGN